MRKRGFSKLCLWGTLLHQGEHYTTATSLQTLHVAPKHGHTPGPAEPHHTEHESSVYGSPNSGGLSAAWQSPPNPTALAPALVGFVFKSIEMKEY